MGYPSSTLAVLDLIDKYLEEGLTEPKIAALCGVSRQVVQRYKRKKCKTPARTEHAKSDITDETVHGVRTVSATSVDCIKSVSALIAEVGADLDDVIVTHQAHRAWTQLGQDSQIFQMHHTSVSLVPRAETLYRAASAYGADSPAFLPAIQTGTALFIPDTQIGFIWGEKHRHLIPLHDRVAMDCVWRIAYATQPEDIFLLGDMLDMASLSMKFPRPATYMQTLQPAIDELGWWLERLRRECPNSRIHYLKGNHEDRLEKLVDSQANELGGIRAAGSNKPLLSLTNLLNMERLQIACQEDYDAGIWLWTDIADVPVWVHHGTVARNGSGKTTRSIAQRSLYHTVQGHVHRNEQFSSTLHGPGGMRNVHSVSPGCLCRLDGVVPGDGHPDWQQGCARFSLIDEKVHPQLVHVQGGIAILDGVHQGVDVAHIIQNDTGWAMVRT